MEGEDMNIEDRRKLDIDWKESVTKQLAEGEEKFKAVVDGQETLIRKLNENTEATLNIGRRLDAHVAATDKKYEKLQPAVDAIETMQTGVRMIGKFGNAVAWVGMWFRKTIIWVAPIVAFVVAVWTYLRTGHWNNP